MFFSHEKGQRPPIIYLSVSKEAITMYIAKHLAIKGFRSLFYVSHQVVLSLMAGLLGAWLLFSIVRSKGL